jgi:predicted transcriptional regulator
LKFIDSHPGITAKELNFKIKVKPTTLEYNINRLIELKLIWKAKNDGMVGYEVITDENLREEIFNRLIKKLMTGEIDEETYFKIKKRLESLDLDELSK